MTLESESLDDPACGLILSYDIHAAFQRRPYGLVKEGCILSVATGLIPTSSRASPRSIIALDMLGTSVVPLV